eukprot:TRINITY_DN3432_c0_g1_i4.p2 TRINITY_DN3432_c0_g1~~TRINITY_DN3432_c0_g1_i4.p2  ORF type:complete len:229 (-),score=62.38 TRINITY_DN3432_c0_g1_i4:257-943(-)
MTATTEAAPAGDSNGPQRGAFILFEGVDRCGKTTQCERLVKRLKEDGHDAVHMRFPDRTTAIGQMINAYLQSTAEMDDRCIHLLFSANRWEAVSTIERRLAAGLTIVCDRYAYSGVAFSAAKPGLTVDWCKAPDKGLPAPDVVIYLDLAVEAAMERGQFGEERYEKADFQRRVRDNFMALKAADGERWAVVDAAASRDDVAAAVHAAAAKAIADVKEAGRPIQKLWMD